MLKRQNLPSLISSRICHDLSSPIGAISNGLELMLLSGIPMTPEMALVEESVNAVMARMSLFRMAFGEGSNDHKVGRSEIDQMCAGLALGGRVKYRWSVDGDPTRSQARLACLSLMCLETAMPYGSTITISQGNSGWTFAATAPRLKNDPELWQSLHDAQPMIGLGASLVHFEILRKLLRDQEQSLFLDVEDTQITMRI